MLGDGGTKVVRVDPATNEVEPATFDAPYGASAMRLFDGELWITASDDGHGARRGSRDR